MTNRTRRDMTAKEFQAALKNQEFRSVFGLWFESTRAGTSSNVNYGGVIGEDRGLCRRETIKHLIAARKEHEAKLAVTA